MTRQLNVIYKKSALKFLKTTDKSTRNDILDSKKLVLAWDPDYTKLTDNEKASLEKAKSEPSFNSIDIDWNNIDKYQWVF